MKSQVRIDQFEDLGSPVDSLLCKLPISDSFKELVRSLGRTLLVSFVLPGISTVA